MQVLERVRTRDAFANLLLPAAIRDAGLPPLDAALATELTYGTLRRLGTLDWVISLYARRGLTELEPAVLDALRLGVYQLLYTDVPAYAAVSETVAVVRGQGAQGFVNAILRRLSAAREDLPWPTREGDIGSFLEIVCSHPGWMVREWLDLMGAREAEALCEEDNRPAPVTVRAAAIPAAELAERFRAAGLDPRPGRWSAQVLSVRGGGAPTSWPGFDEGWFTVQDEASALVAEAVDAQPGETVVDLCAGPGGKTGHLARTTRTVAVELHEPRARMVRDTARRLGVPDRHLVCVVGDGRRPPVRTGADAVLIDAPCSGLGVIRRRAEARWRVRPEDVRTLAGVQRDLVHAGLDLLRPGGRLVYSVCTVTRAETVDVLEDVLQTRGDVAVSEVLPAIPRPAWAPGPALQLVPHDHGTDGMFVALLTLTG